MIVAQVSDAINALEMIGSTGRVEVTQADIDHMVNYLNRDAETLQWVRAEMDARQTNDDDYADFLAGVHSGIQMF